MAIEDNDMISVGSIPLNPNVLDYADAEGKIILHVQDTEEGRSLFMSFKLYGEYSRAYEVRYGDFANVVTKIMGEVVMHNVNDPFEELLLGGN